MDETSSYDNFLALHKQQLELSDVPELFWPNICKKLADDIIDAATSFKLIQIDYGGTEKMPYDPNWLLMASKDIDCSDANHIYLIDHMWTFKVNEMRTQLRHVPNLFKRLCDIMQISAETVEERIDEVSKRVWKYAQTYTLGTDVVPLESKIALWYVLDEVGCAVLHSNNPNFRAIPFFYTPRGMAYTLLFPIRNTKEGDMIFRDFLEGFPDDLQRAAMLIPWEYYPYFNESKWQAEPTTLYFLEGHMVESLPDLSLLKDRVITSRLKVFSEYRYINEYLTSPAFEIVDNEEDADILWYLKHFQEYAELSVNSPHKFVNQFPYEYVITVKDLLAVICRRNSYDEDKTLYTLPLWLPTTFNMKTELEKLVIYYMQRKKAGLDNHWICKPYNLARGLDTYITDNLDFLCRLPMSGPKVAQKYISDPVLFNRPDVGLVKFDIRYVILLTSVNPTHVYIYKNFFLRFSNKQFSLDNFEDYEKHFTVMNYDENAHLFRMLCTDFKEEWCRQYPNYDWDDIEKSIFNMFKELFACATAQDVPRGIAKSPQSRALYAADIMLSWRDSENEKVIQPKLLEINWMPDCQRACEYYPNFYNDVFSVMFFNSRLDTCTKVM